MSNGNLGFIRAAVFPAVVLIVACTIVCGSFTIVPPGHRGVIVRAGEVQSQVLPEGFTFKLPLWTSIELISVRVQETSIKTGAASRDMQKVHATFSINWHINPDRVGEVYKKIGGLEDLSKTIIEKQVHEVLKASTARLSAEEILGRREELKKQIDSGLVEHLAAFGVQVDMVNLVDFDFEPEFNNAVEQKQIAEQMAKRAVYVAQQATEEAKGTIEKAKGQAEAQRLLKQTITEDLIQKLAIEKWDGHLPTTFVAGDKNGSVPFLSLSKQ